MVMDYSQHQRVIDGTGRILDTTMSNPNVGSWVSEDQLKTWINTGMATDADLTAEVAQREAADTDLKNAINQIDHRVQNLEQAKGSYVVQNYKDGSITPSGKGKWCVVEGVEGVSRVENNALSTIDSFGLFHCSLVSYSEGVLTVTGFSVGSQVYKPSIVVPSDRTVLGGIWVKPSKATYAYVSLGSSMLVNTVQLPANVWTFLCNEKALTSATVEFSLYVNVNNDLGASDTVQVKEAFLTDLTLYFGGSIPSDADTIAEIQQNYPHLLLPTEYGTRIVDSSYSGVNSIGFNRFDKTKITTGKVIDYTGAIVDGTGLSISDFMPIQSGGHYYLKSSAIVNVYQVHYYDVGKNWIGRALGSTSNIDFYALAGACYARINVYTANVDDVSFNVSDSSLNGQTFPYMENTLSLTFTGKSAGAVAEMYYPETGEQTKPLGSYIFTGEEPISAWGSSYPNLFKVTVTNNAKRNNTTNFLSTRYMPYGALSGDRYTQNCIYTTSDNAFVINDIECTTVEQFRAKIANVPLYYELKEADPSTFVTPIIDNTLLTEAGGRMSTVQTGTVVDGISDLGFITL